MKIKRISRPCYDKPHRCPGWAGGGLLAAKTTHCPGGSIMNMYEGAHWQWKFHFHSQCGTLVLPDKIRWLDWRWLKFTIDWKIRNIKYQKEWNTKNET